ncbi:flagellar protein FlaG [Ureibacillus thermosphaericus]|uniref:flagellar protein FlaG n=1 Tax=Ureibacillus thermosphaericus TaxID=51173 RepID=UPI000303C2BB|nr:flagellar protein FlaG [Ureibacillus thermosphaericus]
MRISSQPAIDTSTVVKAVENASVDKINKHGSNESLVIDNNIIGNEESTKEKIKQAVKSMNEFLEINHRSSRFVYHEGLERYYITVIDQDTEEVIKEIPPKKLLDAFYEMQKLVGMIVDEKI